jgi:hypothetical protein
MKPPVLCIHTDHCPAANHCPHATPHEPDRWGPCTTPATCLAVFLLPMTDARCVQQENP